jgi:signal transduction histidine kinase
MNQTIVRNDPIAASFEREKDFYNRFAIFWHIVTYATQGYLIFLALKGAVADGISLRVVLSIALVLAQGALYSWVFVRPKCWPPPERRTLAHFAIGLSIAFAQYWFLPLMTTLAWQYAGHVFSGVLSLRKAIVVFVAAILIGSSTQHNWRAFDLDRGDWISLAVPMVMTIVSYWFIQRGFAFSRQQRALLLQLQAANHELEHARERERELAVLRERARLARDMHDTLGHALVTMSVQLEAVQRLYRVDPVRGAAQLEALKVLTRSSMSELRNAIDGLRSPDLELRALDAALQHLAVEMGERSGLTVVCSVTGDITRVPIAAADALWFVAKESLVNVQKHAHATRASLRLCVESARVTLEISDDGLGITSAIDEKPGHYGLRGMRERIASAHGELSVRLGAQGGTCLTAAIPLDLTPHAAAAVNPLA